MIETNKKFNKDLKILVKNGFDLKLLYKVVENLAKEQPPKPKYKDRLSHQMPLFRGKI
ncbi:hypothetical protein BTM112_14770 [Helicobacter pylori]